MSDFSGGATSGASTQGGDAFMADQDNTTSSGQGTVTEAASNVVDAAQDVVSSATNTAQDAASAVVDKVQDVTGAVTGQVAKVSDAAASQVERLADRVAETAISGDTPSAQRQVAQTTVNVLDRTAEYLREGDVNVIVEDLRDMVRRHPLRSLAIGLGLGFLARGSFFPAAAAPSQPSRRPQPRMPYMPPQPVPVYSDMGYDAAYSADIPGTTTVGGTALADSLLYGTDATGIGGDVDVGGTLAGGTDDTASSLYGADTTLGDDLVVGDMLGSAGTATETGGSAFNADADLAGGSGGFGAGADLAGGAGTLGSDALGDASGAADLASDDQFSVAGSDNQTDASSFNTMPSEEQLRQWDSGTSGQSS